MNIDICTILVSGSDTERQTIFYVPEENALYSTLDLDPIDTYPVHSVAEAVKMCDAMWGAGPWWDLQWIIEDYEEEEPVMTYQEFKQNLWTLLDLDNRAITFHILDTEFGTIVGSGIVESSDDLYDTDEAADMLMDNTDATFIQVYSVESWILGNGEADHADPADVELLQSAMEKFNGFFDLLIKDMADPLCSLDEFELENPYYEPDDDDDWDNEDYDDEEYYD